MLKNKLAMRIACIMIFNSIITFAEETINQPTLAHHIKNQYLSSAFGKAEETAASTIVDPNAGFIEKFKQQIDPKKQLLTPREVQDIAFNIVTSTHPFEADIIDSSCIDKLEIAGNGENQSQLLFDNIFSHIHTSVGQAYAALTLCHPISNIQTLINRQNIIIHLKNNGDILKLLDTSLTKMAFTENKTYGVWHSKPMINQELILNSYFGTWINSSTLKQLNTNATALELLNRGGIAQIPCLLAAIPTYITYVLYKYAQTQNIPFNAVLSATAKELKSGSVYILKTASMKHYAYAGFAAAYFGGIFYAIANVYLSHEKMYQHMQDILITISAHIKELKHLSTIVNANQEFLTYLPSLQPLADFNNPSKHSAKLNKFLTMLDTNTFKGEPSSFSLAGRVLAAYELMKQVKDELAPVCAAAGELDIYVALAQLYNAHAEKEAAYCTVNFIENSSIPIINAHSFWNPFIEADKVVVNDAIFDSSCPNSILTGPNTGGKSTIIKALMIDILMAQTFGIAAAKSFSITPFSKLNCFMNISDDIATGASLFKSEVMRAKKLLDLVQSLKQNEFSFVIIDEVFTGTSPQEGEAAALQFTKKLGTYSNNISIIATHYPKMVNLETETNGIYRNHHVEILRNEDGSLHRTFKLKNGPTFMNVAFDILEEEGLFV